MTAACKPGECSTRVVEVAGQVHKHPDDRAVIVMHGSDYVTLKGNLVSKPVTMLAEDVERALDGHAKIVSDAERHEPHEDDPERCVCGWKPDEHRVALNQRRRAVRAHVRALIGSVYA